MKNREKSSTESTPTWLEWIVFVMLSWVIYSQKDGGCLLIRNRLQKIWMTAWWWFVLQQSRWGGLSDPSHIRRHSPCSRHPCIKPISDWSLWSRSFLTIWAWFWWTYYYVSSIVLIIVWHRPSVCLAKIFELLLCRNCWRTRGKQFTPFFVGWATNCTTCFLDVS